MKNNYIKKILIMILSFAFVTQSLAEEFKFDISEIEILDNGNIYNGLYGGTIVTKDELKITSDNFTYNKTKNKIDAFGNVKIIDSKNGIIINTKKIIYLKNEEKIFTLGKTKINVEDKYFIDGDNLIFFRDKMLLSSSNETTIKDTLDNVYILNDFEYLLDEEILKGKEIKVTTNFLKSNSDEYYFDTGFFDLKNKNFLAKDVKVKFFKKMFNNSRNDPRLTGVYGSGDKLNTYLNKGNFTTCEKSDKCPPWILQAKKVRHDKVKKQIIYKDAWLKVYDVPVLYFPKFFHPDPTVKRQSGFLKPNLGGTTALGNSVHTPYFYAIADDKDMTIKPKFYDDGKVVLQSEYRQKTKSSYSIADFSITTGHDSSPNDKGDTRSHFFSKTLMNLNFDNFLRSNLEIQYQKASNDTYLKVFDLESPLLLEDNSVLESIIKLNLEKEDYNFNIFVEQFETLDGANTDRYQYVLPSYGFSRSFNFEKLNGYLNLNSSGNNILKNTNVMQTRVANDLNYTSYNKFYDNGIVSNFGIFAKNLNSVGKNDTQYKTSPQSELMSAYMFNASVPLIKETSESRNILEPKLSLRFSPHEMKDHKGAGRRLDVVNLYSIERLAMGDSFEAGESLTLGFDYRKEKIKTKKNKKQIYNFFDMKLATVIRHKNEDKIPKKSTIGKKNSNIFGEMNYTLSEYISLNYDFSINNNLKKFEYNSIDTRLTFKNFSTDISYVKESGILGSTNVIENRSKYTFDENNSITFDTRRNREINLTAYYNLVYQYQHDCLIAGLNYNTKYYHNTALKPSEGLFFSITIVPLGTFAPENLLK